MWTKVKGYTRPHKSIFLECRSKGQKESRNTWRNSLGLVDPSCLSSDHRPLLDLFGDVLEFESDESQCDRSALLASWTVRSAEFHEL